MSPEDPIVRHFRLTPAQQAALKRLGLNSLHDLLRHFPSRYERAGASVRVRELQPGSKVTLVGTISKLKATKLWKSKRAATEGSFEDGSGRVRVVWFNQPYIASYVPEGSSVKLTGTVAGGEGRPYIANPEVTLVPPGTIAEGLFAPTQDSASGTGASLSIFPVYPESSGITSRWFYHAIARLFESGVHTAIPEPIPAETLAAFHLPEIAPALQWIHAPEKESHAEVARKRFAFEEIFVLQTARARERLEIESDPSFRIERPGERAAEFLAAIPFPPTGAQRRAIAEIAADMERPHPMARLLEGDVGSGKTLVAAAAAYATVRTRPHGRESGTLQVAYMAPTEILAQQHFESFCGYFNHLPVQIGLITGSGCKKFPSKVRGENATDISRAQLLRWVAGGEIAMLVGTHALIQKSVAFRHLGLAIVDEQHRFGTAQRRALARKHESPDSERAPTPHFLSMTATPIPRTLALTIYGDLDLSVLDKLPPGRMKIRTSIVRQEERGEAYEAVRAELARGRQAYVICPRIEEPDPEKLNALQAKSAKAEQKRLQKEVLPEYEVGLLHGAMKPAEKDAVMERFSRGGIHVLVATSVVEVGINVPNATVIVIEGAERFGLAQLHQLRGRVMRSAHQPYCFLVPETRGAASLKRLRALEKSDDGFALAEVDLSSRGMGDLSGRKQWGVSDIGMEALKNARLIEAARESARATVAADPSLERHRALRERVERVSLTAHGE